MQYVYVCYRCDHVFEVSKPMAEASRKEDCPHCGQEAERKYLPIPFSVGWVLSDRSNYEIGYPPNEWVKNV